MNILLSGSNGLIGSALKTSLENEGHNVTRLSRNFDDPINFEGINAVIHLAGENIAQGRWTDAKKSEIKKSRLNGTKKLSEQLAASSHKPSIFISSSATGFYGDREDIILDENSSQGSGFLPEVCVEWEKSTFSAEQAGIRTVHIRTGIVLSKKGGALKKMLPPFKFGGGGILGSGN
ncbi:MAG: NAD-dependent epimerase/dehydratase family protein, partial [Pontiellaceae bacterium]